MARFVPQKVKIYPILRCKKNGRYYIRFRQFKQEKRPTYVWGDTPEEVKRVARDLYKIHAELEW